MGSEFHKHEVGLGLGRRVQIQSQNGWIWFDMDLLRPALHLPLPIPLLPSPFPTAKFSIFPSRRRRRRRTPPVNCYFPSVNTELQNSHLNSVLLFASRAREVIFDSDLKNLMEELDESKGNWENLIEKSSNSVSYMAKCCKPKVGFLYFPFFFFQFFVFIDLIWGFRMELER